jgi:hypothetical protein
VSEIRVRLCLLRESTLLTATVSLGINEGDHHSRFHVFIILILGHVVPPIMHVVESPIGSKCKL